MNYTREEIQAEKERRQRMKSGIENEEPEELGRFKKYALPAAAGVVQGTVNTGASIANLLPGVNLPHLDLEQYLPEGYSKLAAFGGELAAPLGIAGKGIKAVQSAKPILKGVGGFFEKAAKNAGIGYAIGEQENQEGEKYGRGLSAALSGAIPAIGSITNKAVGNKIISKFKSDKAEIGEGYNKLFEAAKEGGVDKVKNIFTHEDVLDWMKGIPKDYRKSLERYSNNPTLENAHRAQSDLGAYGSELNKAKEIQGTLPDELNRRLGHIDEAREKLREEIMNSLFSNKKTAGLGWKYMDLTDQWREKIGPYMDVTDINKAVSGHIDPGDLTSALGRKSAHPFRQLMGEQHPELLINRAVANVLGNKYLKSGALGFGALGALALSQKILSEMNK